MRGRDHRVTLGSALPLYGDAAAETEQGCVADCLQPALRSGFRQQLKASVRPSRIANRQQGATLAQTGMRHT